MKRLARSTILFTFLIVVGSLMFVGTSHSQTEPVSAKDVDVCGQTKEVRDLLINEAEREQYNVRRVEIAGSTYTRYREFSKRMINGIFEGDIFTRKALEESVMRISKMRSNLSDNNGQC